MIKGIGTKIFPMPFINNQILLLISNIVNQTINALYPVSSLPLLTASIYPLK